MRLSTIGLALALWGAGCRYVYSYDDYTNNGDPCDGGADCLNGNCAIGVCCPASCGPCHSCTGGDAGTCVPRTGPDPRCDSGTCGSPGSCN